MSENDKPDREERLRAALRENLKRRKAQVRSRKEQVRSREAQEDTPAERGTEPERENERRSVK